LKEHLVQKSRTNNQIRVPELRVIDEDGSQLGIMKTSDALALAQERGLDLVEVSPQAKPPVAKLVNYDKLRYHQKKLEQQQKKKIKRIEVKNIRLSVRIAEHDMQVKARQAEKFLAEGHKVKIDLMMRGREQAFAELGFKSIQKFLAFIPNHEVEVPETRQGKFISMVIKAAGKPKAEGTASEAKPVAPQPAVKS
jgi:translation initiation factor IF-3